MRFLPSSTVGICVSGVLRAFNGGDSEPLQESVTKLVSHPLTTNGARDRATVTKIEHDDGQVVLLAECNGCSVHHAKFALHHLLKGDRGNELGSRVWTGSAVYTPCTFVALITTSDSISIARRDRRRVGREVRIPRAAREEDDAALLHVPHGAAANVRLRDFFHADRGHHARLDALVLKKILDGQRIDDRTQHAHVVGLDTIHASALRRDRAADDVPSTDHDPQRHTHLDQRPDLVRQLIDDDGLNAEPSLAGECLAGKLEEDPLVLDVQLRSATQSTLLADLHPRETSNLDLLTHGAETLR